MKHLRLMIFILFFSAACLVMIALPELASGELTKFEEDVNNAIDKGLDWLKQQPLAPSDDYYYGKIALRAFAFLNHEYKEAELPDKVKKDISSLKELLNPDYQKNINDLMNRYIRTNPKNNRVIYEVSCAIMALAATGNSDYNDEIKRGAKFLMDAQNQNPNGGFGYPYYMTKKEEQVDISNTQFALLALSHSGELKTNSEVRNKAINFVLSLQNKDGGFGYSNFEKGYSLRKDVESFSYGSVTAAGIWCLMLSDSQNNERVKEAIKEAIGWFEKKYSYDSNPGYDEEPRRWLYYYYWSFVEAFKLTPREVFNLTGLENLAGQLKPEQNNHPQNDWYYDFASRLLTEQNKQDGSWSNGGSGSELLDTVFALYVLEKTKPNNNGNTPPEHKPIKFTTNIEFSDDCFRGEIPIEINFYDVSLKISPPPSCRQPGNDIPYILTVKNEGTVKDSYNIKVDGLPPGFEAIINGFKAHIKEVPIGPLPPCTPTEIPLEIKTPKDYKPSSNDYKPVEFNVTVTSQTYPEVFQTARGKINFYLLSVSVEPKSKDLRLGDPPAKFTITVTNVGTVKDKVKISSNGLPDDFPRPKFKYNSQDSTDKDIIIDISPKETKAVEMTIEAPKKKGIVYTIRIQNIIIYEYDDENDRWIIYR